MSGRGDYPAYPVTPSIEGFHRGLTIREEFASRILPALLQHDKSTQLVAVPLAVALADALLKELEK